MHYEHMHCIQFIIHSSYASSSTFCTSAKFCPRPSANCQVLPSSATANGKTAVICQQHYQRFKRQLVTWLSWISLEFKSPVAKPTKRPKPDFFEPDFGCGPWKIQTLAVAVAYKSCNMGNQQRLVATGLLLNRLPVDSMFSIICHSYNHFSTYP